MTDKVKIDRMSTPVLVAIAVFLLSIASCSHEVATEHEVEEISFTSGRFNLVGELRRPAIDGTYPCVIFVHGDGYATSTEGGYYFPAMERCLRAGYACCSYDKPGCGRSTGRFDESRLRQERADILLDAIALLKLHPSIDSIRIGLWGISQAGYVLPLVLEKSENIAFIVAVSCPAEDGIEQSAFLVGQQVKCAGYPDSVAKYMEELFAQVCKARTYEEYAVAAEALVANPAIPKDMIAGVLSEERWTPRDSLDEGYFNPMGTIANTRIPVLAFFGEKDTQVDPLQGKAGYEQALQVGGNSLSKAVLVPSADHSMVISETGCVEERRSRSRAGWLNQSPVYLDTLEKWLYSL